jgi:hypothetical protein
MLLDGVRVLEFGEHVAAPVAGMLLTEMMLYILGAPVSRPLFSASAPNIDCLRRGGAHVHHGSLRPGAGAT